MNRTMLVVPLLALASCRLPPDSYEACVAQGTRPDISRHDAFALRNDCAARFPAVSASAPKVGHGNPLDALDTQAPSTTPAAPPASTPPASPP